MRGTIIGVFAVVVLIVSMMAFGLFRATLGDVSNKGEAQRAATAAVAQLQVEGLRIERWLAAEANLERAREPFKAGAAKARSEAATTIANTIEETWKDKAPTALRPTMIVLFDVEGVVLGRNGSNLMRGEALGKRHAEMVETIKAGSTGSSVWVDPAHNEHMLASYAPIREGATIIGGLVVGTAFNNERLQSTSDATSKLGLFAAVQQDGKMIVVAQSQQVSEDMTQAAEQGSRALGTDQVVDLGGLGEHYDGAAKVLSGYDGDKTVVMAATPMRQVGSFRSLVFPLLTVLLLGVLLVAVGAHLINNYISQPISDLEDGLLAVINGETDLRFELEHKVLGGLVFRVNSLLNQLLGVKEDDTDEQGKPSIAPSSQSFSAALNVDERMVSLSFDEVEDAQALRDEAPEDYYKRIFDEYLAAKRAIGDPVDHVRFAHFSQRIKGLEQQMQSKHSKPFRYRLESKGKEVVLVAVPLA